jgi:tetratricopeptide (TPR) repeat protein
LHLYLPKLAADVNQELGRHAPGSTNYPASFVAVLKQSVSRLSPESKFLLKLASFLAPNGQFLKIYETIAANSSPSRVEKYGIQCLVLNPEANVMELNQFSLVQQRGVEFDVHPLVQTAIRDSLTPIEREHCLTVLGRLFFSQFGRVAAPTDSRCWNVWWVVYPHMEAFIHHTRQNGDRLALGYLLNHLGLFLNCQGLHKRAVFMLSEAVEVAKSIAGPNHPDTAATLNNLGELLTSIGRPAEAKPHHLDAIAIIENHKPLAPHAESSCWNNLGLCHKALGEHDAAIRLWKLGFSRQRDLFAITLEISPVSFTGIRILLKTECFKSLRLEPQRQPAAASK